MQDPDFNGAGLGREREADPACNGWKLARSYSTILIPCAEENVRCNWVSSQQRKKGLRPNVDRYHLQHTSDSHVVSTLADEAGGR